MTYLPITATFIDEVTADIPSQNWGHREWAQEFQTFADTGIDTVVMIRSGLGERLAFPALSVQQRVPTMPVYQDTVRMFLDLAAQHGIAFYLGLYDSNLFWYRYDWRTEVDLNLAFIDEAWQRYGDSPAFRGWYLPHETTDSSLRIIDINTTLAARLKQITPHLPVMVSPFFYGRSDLWNGGDLRLRPRDPQEHVRLWSEIFAAYAGLVDVCAFQDGTTDLMRSAEYFAATAAEATAHGITSWANIETFDRDMPIKFPPTDWRKLAHKLDAVQGLVDKVITFEFSHFLSPNSTWPSARLLHARYLELLRAKESR
ncbi:MAG: DUF4434 domain-containing protein [Cellulomonas sp.]|nr:DUF4434 domain-containing protein [Cellulomonas sp.]